MPALIILALFLIGLLFLVGGYYFSQVFYHRRHEVKYSLFRMFPYEFNYPSSFKNNVYGNIAFILGMTATVSSVIYALFKSQATLDITNIIIVVLAIVLAGMICFLFFMPLTFLRTHMVVSSLAMVLAIALPGMIAYLAIIKLKIVVGNTNTVLSIIALVISVLLAVTMLLFTFNPKASYKIYLEKAKDENGQEVLVRPKFIPMAFNEWLAIIVFALSPIGLVILGFIK